MSSEEFKLNNVKCGGCASAIQDGLGALPGINGVEVVIESGQLTVTGENLDRAALAAKLADLDYPEA